MTSGKIKYQWTALALLVMLAINIVIPSTLMAVNLYCQGSSPDVNEVNNGTECCSDRKLSSSAGISDAQEQDNYCTFEQACKQEISDPLTELQTLLPAETYVSAAPETSSFSNPILDRNTFSYVSLDSSLLYPTPPTFLLNSTFLN